jgi:hypothetical protein
MTTKLFTVTLGQSQRPTNKGDDEELEYSFDKSTTMNVSPVSGRKAVVLFIVSLAVMVSSRHIGADQTRTCTPPSSNSMYEWEDYNFYQVLDLPSHPPTASRKKRRKGRDHISSSDIRKAYRKQAQLYHPDKVAKNQTITVEERTARFARIAEAYEVLSDDQKRLEYDDFLLDCEDHLSGQDDETESGGWSSVFDNLSTDPRRVFEEFFFGSSSSEPTWEENVRYDDPFKSRHERSTPIRVYETREVRHDPYTGAEILRILQTEEFSTNVEGRLFFRVLGQDFVEQNDPVYGVDYVPVTQPFLVEEGYMQDSSHRPSSNTLSPGEFLRPESTLLKSSNGRYYAGLSSHCELLIMTDAWVEETVLWSSDTYVPPSHLYRAGGCFLGLRGPNLVLVLGSPDRPGTILWYSDVPESVVAEEERLRAKGGPASLFVARLDDDGSLALYRHETAPRHDHGEEQKWWSSAFLGRAAGSPMPRTRAARAWAHVQTWMRKRFEKHQKALMFPREVCIYATGPAGCNAQGRKILHVAYSVGHSVKDTMTKIDNAIDTFVESITEENDEDFLDTAFRVAYTASNGLLRAGRSLCRMQARILHNVVRSMRERFESSKRS